MKARTIMVVAALMLAVPLVAANVNGFENFVLSRGDFKSNPSRTIVDFSSRTHTEVGDVVDNFSSKKPRPLLLRIR